VFHWLRITVRRRIPAITGLLLLATVIPFSYRAYSRLRRAEAKDSHVGTAAGLQNPESSTDPQLLLAEADRFYWLYNGTKAAPLYARAERLFANMAKCTSLSAKSVAGLLPRYAGYGIRGACGKAASVRRPTRPCSRRAACR